MKATQKADGSIEISEQTPNGTAIYHTSDFRSYAPERATRQDGSTVMMRLCEELIEGRWEAFYAVAS